MSFQGRVSGIYCISGAVWQSVCNLEFQIDHVASFEPHGIKELNKTPVPPIYQGIYGINPHLFHVVEHLLHENPSDGLALIGWVDVNCVYSSDILRDRGVTELRQ